MTSDLEDAAMPASGPLFTPRFSGDQLWIDVRRGTVLYIESCGTFVSVERKVEDRWEPLRDERFEHLDTGYYLDGAFVAPSAEEGCHVPSCTRLGGDTFYAVLEFSKSGPPRGEALLGYGNWSRVGSKHVDDQLALASQKKMRPMLRTRHAIEQHLESKTTF